MTKKDMTPFQNAVLRTIINKVNFDKTHYGTKLTGKSVTVHEMYDFNPAGTDYLDILGEYAMHFSVTTDWENESEEPQKASWHITLFEDGDMSVRLLEVK